MGSPLVLHPALLFPSILKTTCLIPAVARTDKITGLVQKGWLIFNQTRVAFSSFLLPLILPLQLKQFVSNTHIFVQSGNARNSPLAGDEIWKDFILVIATNLFSF